MAKSVIDTFEQFYPPNRAAWRQWLEENHETSPGVWVIRYKAGTQQPTITYADIAEEALCYGWIDSLQRKLDDDRSILMVTPRNRKSGWSKVNKERIERLLAAGLLMPSGLAKIEEAKAEGSWNALDEAEALTMPDDLRDALEANEDAKRHYEAFPPSSKKIILQWVASAKKPETRANRIAETVRLAAQNIKANHYRQ